jgi:hypothetical protein
MSSEKLMARTEMLLDIIIKHLYEEQNCQHSVLDIFKEIFQN